MKSESESTRDRRQGDLLNASACDSERARNTRPVPHKVQLKVPHVVLDLERPQAPPSLEIWATYGTDYPPSTSCVRVVGSVLI